MAAAARRSDEKYLELVCARMAEAINEAVANLQPARLKIATGEAKGKIAYNYYAEQLYDPRCHVIQALDASGKPIATLVNYAIHPEVLGSDAGICSPDLIGPLYERIAGKGRRDGHFHEQRPGRDGHRRQPAAEAARKPGPGRSASASAACWPTKRCGSFSDAPEQASPKLYCAARALDAAGGFAR